jgi:hypothetical protein
VSRCTVDHEQSRVVLSLASPDAPAYYDPDHATRHSHHVAVVPYACLC